MYQRANDLENALQHFKLAVGIIDIELKKQNGIDDIISNALETNLKVRKCLKWIRWCIFCNSG
jgi:hypothetical protein